MNREDFISDNLVDMRDRLKQNYQKMEAEAHGTAVPEALAPASEPEKAAPAGVGGDERAQAVALRGELEKQWHYDLAAAGTEIAKLETQLKLYQEFQQNVESRLNELHRPESRPATGAEALAKLQRMQIEHQAGRGQVLGLVASKNSASNAPVQIVHKHRKFEEIMYEAIPLFAALLLAALVISGALALIFM